MNSCEFVYVIHIAGTPEQAWETLTNAETLKKNWGKIRSSWEPGAAVAEVSDSGAVMWNGTVRRSEAPRVLAFTFEMPGSGEASTEVTFEIGAPVSPVTPGAEVVRLSLTHTGFGADSKAFAGCARAWPEILSSMKSYIETGMPLPFAWKH